MAGGTRRKWWVVAGVAVAVLVLISGAAIYAGAHTPVVSGLHYLDEGLDAFAVEFDRTAGVPRVVLLLSPA